MNYFTKQLSDTSVKLCCGGVNCPIVETVDSDSVKITDDDGNSIILKKGQASLISSATNLLEGKSELLLG
jgi:hypothetical protein